MATAFVGLAVGIAVFASIGFWAAHGLGRSQKNKVVPGRTISDEDHNEEGINQSTQVGAGQNSKR